MSLQCVQSDSSSICGLFEITEVLGNQVRALIHVPVTMYIICHGVRLSLLFCYTRYPYTGCPDTITRMPTFRF